MKSGILLVAALLIAAGSYSGQASADPPPARRAPVLRTAAIDSAPATEYEATAATGGDTASPANGPAVRSRCTCNLPRIFCYCGGKYCPKPLPTACFKVKTVCDDYCPKPLPQACFKVKTVCDDYCDKPLPCFPPLPCPKPCADCHP